MEVDEEDFEQPSSSDNKASKKRFEVKKVKWQHLLISSFFYLLFKKKCAMLSLCFCHFICTEI